MLLGRGGERTRIAGLLEGARAGRSGALILRGEPGIGKSALLADTRARATDMLVLSARGAEAERELPYAGLSALLAPVKGGLEEIPVPQRRALAVALALAPAGPVDRFAAYAGVLSVLAGAAERDPVLVTVDDLHWLDAPSAEALLFVARRLAVEGIAMLFAAREGEEATVEPGGLPELRLTGLEDEAVAHLLGEVTRRRVPRSTARRLREATGGNPLALHELAALLPPAQLEGREPLPDPLPVGADLGDVFGRQIAVLPAEAQRALVVASADPTVAPETLARALAALGLDAAALEPAEEAGLVVIERAGVAFRHPLIRSVAYHRASGRARRAAHRALADALARAGERARAAWHRSEAALEPDEAVAAELEAVAREALGRGAPEPAGNALAMAARMSRGREVRTRRLVEAAQHLSLAGAADRARALLDEALASAHGDAVLRADVQHARAQVEAFHGRTLATPELLLAEADRVRPFDETRAAAMLLDASLFSLMGGRPREALRLAQEAAAATESVDRPSAFVAMCSLGMSLALAGRASEAREVLARAERELERPDIFATGVFAAWCLQPLIWLEEYEHGHAALTNLLERARTAGGVAVLPYILACLTEAEFWLGDWRSAYAHATQSVTLAENLEQRVELSNSLVRLAMVEAGRGRAADCRQHVEHALALAEEYEIGSIRILAKTALAVLDLGLGRLEAVLEDLEEEGHKAVAVGLEEPAVAPWAQNLAEALIRLGDSQRAERTLALLADQAEISGGRLARAAVARCRGLLATTDDEAHEWFTRALALHDERPARFERARTELCFGERLRRGGRRTEAREQLNRALRTFNDLGAEPWAERARRELRASGERRRRRAAETTDELTSQELQVALMAAEGATNREIAAALFLSPKTIEMHLTRAYRKMDVRSRTQLARRLARHVQA